MTIRFTKVEEPATDEAPPAPQALLWLPPASKGEAEECLFRFLRSLLDGRPQASRPLLIEPATLQALCRAPHPQLSEALRRCLDRLLIEIAPRRWGDLALSPAVLAVALASYTSLVPPLAPRPDVRDPLDSFGAALAAAIPPARDLPNLLAYHALLETVAAALPDLTPPRADLLESLLRRSPLTAAYHLHLATPPALVALAAELLLGWGRAAPEVAPWRDDREWLAALAPALRRPEIAAYLRQRWLTLPETRAACRNLGLFLEALRRQGGYRELILAFYEDYDRCAARTARDAWGDSDRGWPLLAQIEALLRADGSSEAAIRLNRWGNEYFMKFRPLVQVIIADGHPPTDFNLLSNGLINGVRALMEWTSEGPGRRLRAQDVEFEESKA